MGKRQNFMIMVGMVAASALISGCGISEANVDEPVAETPSAAIPVAVASAERGTIEALYAGTASLEAESEAPVVAKVGGEIVEILVEEGDRVTKGQKLARLDGRKLKLMMDRARADLDKLAQEYKRNTELHEKGLVAAGTFENLKFEMDALDAAYRLAKLNFDYASIRAPIDGVITDRSIKVGNTVNENEQVFQITSLDSLQAFLHVPQRDLHKFQTGQQARMSIDAAPGEEFDSRIERISPSISAETGTFKVTMSVTETEQLKPGMFARFSIAYDKHEDAVLVPYAALVDEDYENAVYVVEDGVAHRKVVSTGISSDGKIEITDGLDGRESVVIVGQNGLKDGTLVAEQTG